MTMTLLDWLLTIAVILAGTLLGTAIGLGLGYLITRFIEWKCK